MSTADPFPPLESLTERSAAARLMVGTITGKAEPWKVDPLFHAQLLSTARVTDTAIQFYERSRADFEDYFARKGNSDHALLMYGGNMEACIANTHRALRLAQALRRNPNPAVRDPTSKTDWNLLTRREDSIRKMRDACEHVYEYRNPSTAA